MLGATLSSVHVYQMKSHVAACSIQQMHKTSSFCVITKLTLLMLFFNHTVSNMKNSYQHPIYYFNEFSWLQMRLKVPTVSLDCPSVYKYWSNTATDLE